MKKQLLILSVAAFAALPAFSRDFTYQGVTYTVLDEADATCETKAGIEYQSGGNNVSGDLVLPAKPLDGSKEYSLVRIGHDSFYGCTEITSLVIPEGVTEISDNAFKTCVAMTSAKLPESLTKIGEWAFYTCVSLEEITIPENVTSLGDFAFRSCANMTKANIPQNITALPRFLFQECFKLESINIPEGVTSIGNFAFSECETLSEINIPDAVTYIGLSAFSKCATLANVTIGNSVETIDENAFSQCPQLDEIVIPNSVKSINEAAFKSSPLKKVVMGNGVKTIEQDAFYGCPIKELYITAQVPPVADDNSFSAFNELYVQGQAALARYQQSTLTWARFEIDTMTEPTEMSGSETTLDLKEGETAQLTATITPADVDLPYIYWLSSDPKVATVSRDGLVTVAEKVEGDVVCTITAETLYANGPTREFTLNIKGSPAGVEIVADDNSADNDAPAAYYDLNGRRVASPANGIFIKVKGNSATKEIIR